jgi:acetoin utilization protein AcuB
MTRAPHTIGPDARLTEAHALMRALQVRHLPVVDRGKVVGLLSQRDLHFIETLRDVDPEIVQVAEAMTEELYTVQPGDDLAEVALEMAGRKYGSAVVVDRGKMVGLFTTTDALRALATFVTEEVSHVRPRDRVLAGP